MENVLIAYDLGYEDVACQRLFQILNYYPYANLYHGQPVEQIDCLIDLMSYSISSDKAKKLNHAGVPIILFGDIRQTSQTKGVIRIDPIEDESDEIPFNLIQTLNVIEAFQNKDHPLSRLSLKDWNNLEDKYLLNTLQEAASADFDFKDTLGETAMSLARKIAQGDQIVGDLSQIVFWLEIAEESCFEDEQYEAGMMLAWLDHYGNLLGQDLKDRMAPYQPTKALMRYLDMRSKDVTGEVEYHIGRLYLKEQKVQDALSWMKQSMRLGYEDSIEYLSRYRWNSFSLKEIDELGPLFLQYFRTNINRGLVNILETYFRTRRTRLFWLFNKTAPYFKEYHYILSLSYMGGFGTRKNLDKALDHLVKVRVRAEKDPNWFGSFLTYWVFLRSHKEKSDFYRMMTMEELRKSLGLFHNIEEVYQLGKILQNNPVTNYASIVLLEEAAGFGLKKAIYDSGMFYLEQGNIEKAKKWLSQLTV